MVHRRPRRHDQKEKKCWNLAEDVTTYELPPLGAKMGACAIDAWPNLKKKKVLLHEILLLVFSILPGVLVGLLEGKHQSINCNGFAAVIEN
jgi:hypothetical protein